MEKQIIEKLNLISKNNEDIKNELLILFTKMNRYKTFNNYTSIKS